MASRPRKQPQIDPSPQATRVRENQRRSRARKREYLASLEEQLQQCRKEGAKASVDVQVAARRVVAENRALRLLLNELGLESDEIQQRIRRMKEGVDGGIDRANGWICEKCRGEVVAVARPCNTGGASETAVATLSTPPTTTLVPSDICDNTALLDNIGGQPLGESSILSTASSHTRSLDDNKGPTFVENSNIMSRSTSDQQSSQSAENDELDIDLSQFLVDITTDDVVTESAVGFPDFDFQESLTPATEEQEPVSLDLAFSGDMNENCFCPNVDKSPAVDKTSSTPCTVAYRLLKALNTRREKEKDMFEIVLELWNGFSIAPEGDTEGCRVDDNVLFKVVGELCLDPPAV